MGIFQGSSRGCTWKQQIRDPTMTWGRARPRGGAPGGLQKRRRPKKKRAEATESVKSTGGLTGVMMRRRTFPGAQKHTLPLALSNPRSLASPLTTPITTSQEKTSCPESLSGASTGKRRAAWRRKTMIICFSLSRGKKSLNCETASDLAFRHLSALHVCNILAIFLSSKIE